MSHPVVDAITSRLAPIREKYGDAAYNRALEQAARELIRTESPEVQGFVREAFKGQVDFERIDREVKFGSVPNNAAAEQLIAQQLRSQMPGLQTQAQFDAFMASFNALRTFMSHTFLGHKDLASQAREALLESLKIAEQATELSEKLGQVPEAATSPEAEKFKTPPKEFGELEIQQSLLEELAAIDTKEKLTQWYGANRARLDQVVNPNLRNQLFDTIRRRSNAFPM